MTEEQKQTKELVLEIKRTNPKENPVTYHIQNMQDIAKCVNSNNVDGFLEDFEMVIRSIVTLKILAEEHNDKINFPSFEWIDDKQ